MGWLSAAVGVGGSLLGGMLGGHNERAAIRAQNEYNKPINIRKRAEEAGFNPLLFVGPGVGQQTATGGANYMGSAIADASAMVADAMKDRTSEKLAIRNLELENQKLEKEIQQMTLRPKTPGVYQSGAAAGAAVLKKPEVILAKEGDDSFIGPRQPVQLFNPTANKWVGLDPKVADRLGLKSGDAILAEDYEAILGDLGSEIVNTPNAVNEAIGQGKVFWEGIKFGKPKPKPEPKRAVPSELPWW